MPANASYFRHSALVLSACSLSAVTTVVWNAAGLYRTNAMNWPSSWIVPKYPSAFAAFLTLSSFPVRRSNTFSAPSGI